MSKKKHFESTIKQVVFTMSVQTNMCESNMYGRLQSLADSFMVHRFTINKNAKMNQTMYETIINCIFVFMKEMVIPVNTDLRRYVWSVFFFPANLEDKGHKS